MVRVFSLFLFLFSGLAQAAVNVWVDRNPVNINESFQLVFESDQDVDREPDFSVLEKDFEILTRSQGSNMQIVNGSISRSVRWTINMMAKRAGSFQIPSIRFDQTSSNPVTIKVNKAASSNPSNGKANEPIFLDASATPTAGYVQEEIIYTVRFYRAVNIRGASMGDPTVKGGEVIVEKLGDDKSFETMHNGRRYVVIERKYALFPQQSGKMTIEPIELTAELNMAARNRFDPFSQNTRTQRVTSDAIKLNVKAVPAAAKNSSWLPSSRVTLQEAWSSDKFVVGEPVTRTITIEAEGLTAAQLPSLAAAEVDGFKLYPDQPTLNDGKSESGITGLREEKIAMIPTRSGEFTLPAVTLKWWNTDKKRIETTTLPAKKIKVAVGEAGINNNIPAISSPLPISQPVTISQQQSSESGIWFWISMALALLWLLTVMAWFLSNRSRGESTTVEKKSKKDNGASLGEVKKSCLANDPEATKTALLGWAKNYWPEQPPCNLQEIGVHFDSELASELDRLSRALYAKESTEWQGESLWLAMKKLPKQKNKAVDKITTLLPMYPA